MKQPIRILSALALSLLASVSLRAADTVEIKQRWQAGKKYYQTMLTEQQSKLEVAGQKMDQTSSMTIELTMTVASQALGQPKRMTIRYERAAMQIGMNGQKMGFDSADPSSANDPLGLSKTLGGTVGKELKVLLNDQDQVTDVENFDEFMKNLAPSAVPGFDPSENVQPWEALSHMLQEGGLHAMPGKAVAVGESWPFNTQVDLPQLGKVGMSGTYTLKSLGEHDGATLRRDFVRWNGFHGSRRRSRCRWQNPGLGHRAGPEGEQRNGQRNHLV